MSNLLSPGSAGRFGTGIWDLSAAAPAALWRDKGIGKKMSAKHRQPCGLPHSGRPSRAAVHELAGESAVLILTDFSMGWNTWPNLKEDQATALLDLIRERCKRYTIVTTAHTGDELAEVCPELLSSICSATNSQKALVKMEPIPNYTPTPQPEPEEQDMPF